MESESDSKVPSVVEKVEPTTKAKGRPKKTSHKAKMANVDKKVKKKPVSKSLGKKKSEAPAIDARLVDRCFELKLSFSALRSA
ncbi:hypothetical protein CsatB_000523 [Cannabis sativa]